MKKIILTVLALVILVVVGAASYVYFALPNVGPAPDLKIAYTPERIQHGEYLARHVSLCMDCHGVRDWSRFAGPPEAGTLGRGGENFNEQMGFPGNFYSKNNLRQLDTRARMLDHLQHFQQWDGRQSAQSPFQLWDLYIWFARVLLGQRMLHEYYG